LKFEQDTMAQYEQMYAALHSTQLKVFGDGKLRQDSYRSWAAARAGHLKGYEMAITQAMCTSFKVEAFGGIHDLDTDTIRIALYTSASYP
jgi:hypothetical protein